MQVSCYECALRACGLFKPITRNELGAINEIKRDHIALNAGAEIIRSGDESPEIYTLYSVGLSASRRYSTGAVRF
jgi:hypothetical protein